MNTTQNNLAGVVNTFKKPPKRADFVIPVQSNEQDTEMHIPINLIDPSPYQPRLLFDQDELIALAKSIEQVGQVTPISVRQLPNGRYELVGGERRVRALRMLSKTTVHAVVKVLTDFQAAIHSNSDNDSKADLTDYERGRSYHSLITSGKVATQTELALNIGISNSTVTRCLSYMRLSQPVLDMLDRNPRMIGNRCVADFANLCENGHSAIVEKHVALLFEGQCSQEAALANAKNEALPKAIKSNSVAPVASSTGKALGNITLSRRSIIFKCEKGVDPEVIYQAIANALKNS